MIKIITFLLVSIGIFYLVVAENSQVLSTTPGGTVDPSKYEVKLVLNDPLQVICTVHPNVSVVDIMLLEDTTGSMTPFINVLKSSFHNIYVGLAANYPSPRYSLAQYKDFGDPFVYKREINFSPSEAAVQGAINTLAASGGGDLPEALYNAMVTYVSDVSYRPNSRRVMLIFNDAVSHTTADNPAYKSQADAIAALNSKNIIPIFFTTQLAFYQTFVNNLGRGKVISISSDSTVFLNGIISAVGDVLNIINTNIVQTQNYIKSVSPSSQTFTTNDPIDFVVSLLDDGSGSGAPDYTATVEFLPNWGECVINISQVVRNKPPICDAHPGEFLLWPPNHKYVNVDILGVTDPDGDPITITVTSILQSEPTDVHGSGDTCPDGTGVGTSIASVRRERSGTLNGRRYKISFTASDGRGGTCDGNVEVCVPHDQGNNNSCQNTAEPTIDSTIC
jgi:hypothetical protein